jgi:hypothetical protein
MATKPLLLTVSHSTTTCPVVVPHLRPYPEYVASTSTGQGFVKNKRFNRTRDICSRWAWLANPVTVDTRYM